VFQDGQQSYPAPQSTGGLQVRPAGFTATPQPRGRTFPSQYLCAIGFRVIRFLGWEAPPLRAALPTNATRPRAYARRPCARALTGLPPLQVLHSHRASRAHSSLRIREGIQAFRSPLLGPSRLLSVPPPTNMLKFGGYSAPAGAFGHPGIRPLPFTRASAFRCGLPRTLNRAIHRPGFVFFQVTPF